MKRHISSRARIGMRGGERVGIDTASTTVARSFNSNARSSSRVKVLVGHQVASLANAFTRSCGRRYLLCFNASSVCLRTLTGSWPRRVAMTPSNPHGRATSETAAIGTCVQCAFRASRARKKVPTRAPTSDGRRRARAQRAMGREKLPAVRPRYPLPSSSTPPLDVEPIEVTHGRDLMKSVDQ